MSPWFNFIFFPEILMLLATSTEIYLWFYALSLSVFINFRLSFVSVLKSSSKAFSCTLHVWRVLVFPGFCLIWLRVISLVKISVVFVFFQYKQFAWCRFSRYETYHFFFLMRIFDWCDSSETHINIFWSTADGLIWVYFHIHWTEARNGRASHDSGDSWITKKAGTFLALRSWRCHGGLITSPSGFPPLFMNKHQHCFLWIF